MQGQPIQFKNLTQYGDRTAYLVATGKQAPPFDPSKPIRLWVDPGVAVEQFFNGNAGSPAFVPQTFSPGELDAPNLTGAPTYPVYTPAATKATWMGGAPLPAQYLCSQSDAQLVATAVGGTLANGVDTYRRLGVLFGLDTSDPRQPWVISVDGTTQFAGPMVVAMYANGIGAPGSFVKDPTSGTWNWISTHIPDGNDGLQHPTLGLPVVPLATGFMLTSDPALTGAPASLIPLVMIVPIGATVIGTGTAGSSEDSAKIDKILELVTKISVARILGL